MNNIRAIEALNQRELDAGIPPSASWHTDWADTAYVYIGGLPYELSEGDIITIFSQYGEPVHVNLIRDKETGKSKGFAFLKYEDQRSTTLAVDNLGGSNILGRTIRVDHTRYKPKDGDGTEELGVASREDDDDDGARRKRRRDIARSPIPELLPEEIELRKLIAEHDDDDPMKDYLVREKKEQVQKALEKRDKKKASRRKRDDHDGYRRERWYQYRSNSPEKRSHRERPRSDERQHDGQRSEHRTQKKPQESRLHRDNYDRPRRERSDKEKGILRQSLERGIADRDRKSRRHRSRSQ